MAGAGYKGRQAVAYLLVAAVRQGRTQPSSFTIQSSIILEKNLLFVEQKKKKETKF